MFPTLASTRDHSKKAPFNEKPRSLKKKNRSAPNTYWKLPYQRVGNLHYLELHQDQTKPRVFRFLLVFFFFCFSLIWLCLYFFILHLV